MSIKKILIANRGEIACRIIKTCQKLGVKTVAIFSNIDRHAMFVNLADEAYPLNSDKLHESYLDCEKIISIAKQSNCQAIHPGYGFLSENTVFAKLCQDNDIIFIGPSASCITQMGCKKQAKTLMQHNNIPVVPGFNIEPTDNEAALFEKADSVGYPLLIKAASGGGGKGMKRVGSQHELLNAIASAKREALKSFADDTLLVEKYLDNPRHIEVQIFADNHGNCVHVFDRDCSIQRRHQKIIEEAPAVNIPQAIRENMFQTAINAAKAINYSGAGTIEFLLNGDDFYFMEMNTRLQVEHPVSEYISNIDLVEWQIHVANNLPLPLHQEHILQTGHAIEVRLYAEDPDNQFLPQIGKLSHCSWPEAQANLRIDTGVQCLDEISMHYDPMIAKIITHAKTRSAAIYAMQQALDDTIIAGLKTNLSFLKNILAQNAFQQANLSTHYLTQNPIQKVTSLKTCALAAATYKQLLKQVTQNTSPWHTPNAWQANLAKKLSFEFSTGDTLVSLSLLQKSAENYHSDVEGFETYQAHLETPNTLVLQTHHHRHIFKLFENNTASIIDVFTHSAQYTLSKPTPTFDTSSSSENSLNAPMPGMVVALTCQKGSMVKKDQVLMIIEAMKMEHPIKAPYDGIIDDIYYKLGCQVKEGQPLLSIHKDKEMA